MKYKSKIIDRLTGETVYTSREYPTWEAAQHAAEAKCRRYFCGDRYAIVTK